MKKIDTLLIRLVDFTLSCPKTVLVAAALLTATSIFFTQKIEIRSNFSDLLPDDHPSVIQARELEKTVGGASFIVIAAETNNPTAAVRFLGDLRETLEQMGFVKGRAVSPLDFSKASGFAGALRIDDSPPADFFKKASLLYLSLEDLDRLKARIQFRIDQAKLKKMKLLIDFDGGHDSFNEDIEELKGKYATYLSPMSHYQNKEGTLFASLIKPDWRATDVSKTQGFVEHLNRIVQGLNPAGYDPSLNVRFTGPYIKQMTQKKILLKDAALVSALSFLGAIAYLVFHFRRKRAVFLIGIPLTVSTLWSLGVAYFLFGSLNLFSSAACAILLGLAADYGIHFYSEYRRHRRLGEAPEEALSLSISHLGRAFVAASSTTAAAFLSLAFTRFKAMHETGLIAGLGILLCGAAFILIFPPLTLLIERRWPEIMDVTSPQNAEMLPRWGVSGGESGFAPRLEPQHPALPVQGGLAWAEAKQKFSHRWMHWVFSPKNLAVTGMILLLPLLSLALGRLNFDYNLNHILGRQETRELDRRIDSIFNHSVNPEVALAKNYEDAGRVAAAIRKVQRKNEKTPEGSTIKGALALADFVPEAQKEKMAKIREIGALFTPLVLRAMGEEDRRSYESLKPMLDPGPITEASIPDQIRNKFQDRDGQVGRTVFVFPNFEMTRADRFMRFVEEIREVTCEDCSGPFYASGESTVFYEIVKMLFREGKYVVGFTLLMILGALWLNFRSAGATFLVFTPLAVGFLATLGWMGLTGLSFNIINLAAIPIILGTADDYGVHFYQRFADHPGESLHEAYRITFRPILGSAVTTLIGFGSLGVADMGGIRSFGMTCVLGITLCTITTLVWFPALLALRKRRKIEVVREAVPSVSFQKVT
jgi:predicted RND superfamily exporter protein